MASSIDTLVTGERRLPDAADVSPAQQATALTAAHSAAATAPIAGHGATLGDAFDFSALFASIPSAAMLEARLGQAFAEVKDAFVDLRDAHHGEHPLADFAAQLRDGPIGDIVGAVLSRPTADPQADWLV